MAIRVEHQGAGAGAGIDLVANKKRKYDLQLKQQEKQQDRMFQVGMQNRGAMMQRENMIIGNNLQDNQRRQAGEEAQAALKEKREFDAKLRGQDRQNQLADIENARVFNMEQQDRQFQMQQEAEQNRRRFALQDRANAMRVDNLNKAVANNEFTPQATAMLQERLDKEMELLTKDPEELEIDATQREEALWKLRNEMRIISIHGRRPPEAPQEQQVPTAQQAFQDPANRKSYTELATQILGSGDNPQPITAEAVAATATDLYNRFSGVGQQAQQGQQMQGAAAGQMQGQPAAQGQSVNPMSQPLPKDLTFNWQKTMEAASSDESKENLTQAYRGMQNLPQEARNAFSLFVNPAVDQETRSLAGQILEKNGFKKEELGKLSEYRDLGTPFQKINIPSPAAPQKKAPMAEGDTSWMPRIDRGPTDFSKALEGMDDESRSELESAIRVRDKHFQEYNASKAGNAKSDASYKDSRKLGRMDRTQDIPVDSSGRNARLIGQLIDMLIDDNSTDEQKEMADKTLIELGVDLGKEFKSGKSKEGKDPLYVRGALGAVEMAPMIYGP